MGAPEGSLAGSASVTSNTNLIAAPAAHSGLLNIGDRARGVVLVWRRNGTGLRMQVPIEAAAHGWLPGTEVRSL
jgi:hypothetical protein